MSEVLRDADHKNDEFLATLAHELRGPLAPFRNAVHYLKLSGPPEPALEAARDVIERQVSHMALLIDDLLDISRITLNKMEMHRERVPLTTILTTPSKPPARMPRRPATGSPSVCPTSRSTWTPTRPD